MANATWSLFQDPESQTRHGSEKSCWSRSLEGLGTEGRLGLGGSLTYPCILTDCLVNQLLLRGRQRGFLPSSSVSSLITHRHVICFCISLPYSCSFHFTTKQLSCLYAYVYTIPHFILSQCKINQAVTLKLGV